MPYTHRSKENLVREGIERERIYVTGNPIREVLTHYEPQHPGERRARALRSAAEGLLPPHDAPGGERR